ncbi:MAG: hypothetical protein WBW88_07195 [Rhodothermales bacterium]
MDENPLDDVTALRVRHDEALDLRWPERCEGDIRRVLAVVDELRN